MSEQQRTLEDIVMELVAPFPPDQVETRNQGGRTLHYITARMVQSRLDEVVGPFNWKVAYRETAKGVVAALSLRTGPDAEWVTKEDCGGFPRMEGKGGELNEEDDVKAGYSDALKRVGVAWGIFRYGYEEGIPHYARPMFEGKDWLPKSAPPPPRDSGGYQRPPDRQQPQRTQANGNSGGFSNGDAPSTGKALFAWATDKGEAQGNKYKVVDVINKLRDSKGWPERMVQWSRDQVEEAYQYALDEVPF